MNPKDLIPAMDAYGVPSPVWFFLTLLIVTLVLHFIAMGYVFSATLLHVFLAPKAREGSAAEWMLRRTEGPLPVALSFTVTLGVAPLLFVQVLYQPVFYTANVLIGYQWLGVIGVLIAGFYLIYLVYGGRCFGRPVAPALHTLARLAIFGSIAYVMTTMTVNALLAMMPETWKAVRESGGNFLLMQTPILWPRLLHNALTALVIGGVWMIALGIRSERMETEPVAKEGARRLRRIGAMITMHGTLLQVAVGIWLLMAENKAVRAMLFSGRLEAILWMVALLGTAGLLMVSVGLLMQSSGQLLNALWGVLALTLGGMFAGREAARQVHLAAYMDIHQWAVKPQYSSLALFLLLFAAALGIVAMMIVWLMNEWRLPKEK